VYMFTDGFVLPLPHPHSHRNLQCPATCAKTSLRYASTF
jgi:hypothetical protein